MVLENLICKRTLKRHKMHNFSILGKRWKSSMKTLREVLQESKKIHIEAEPKANEIIHDKEEKEEK